MHHQPSRPPRPQVAVLPDKELLDRADAAILRYAAEVTDLRTAIASRRMAAEFAGVEDVLQRCRRRAPGPDGG
jgi:hypothetical protein